MSNVSTTQVQRVLHTMQEWLPWKRWPLPSWILGKKVLAGGRMYRALGRPAMRGGVLETLPVYKLRTCRYRSIIISRTMDINMNIHWLQHVPFEGLGAIEKWAGRMGHTLCCTRLFAGDPLPQQDAFEMLVVMGGPMGIYDEQEYPWLIQEKIFIKATISAGKPVLGICLGAQLLADVLGARVTANREKEIGWFPVTRTDAVPSGLTGVLPESQTVFHWHGDTFDLPADAVHLYSSIGCHNQAFQYKDRVLALQFHLETTPESAVSLINNCRHELVRGPWIQTELEIIDSNEKFAGINLTMDRILDYLASFSR